MTGTIVHFGISDCARLRVLSTQGYEVYACGNSLATFQDTLHLHHADAVVFDDDDARDLIAQACNISASLSPAPRILFSRSASGLRPQDFAVTIEPLTPPKDWLQIIEKTIEHTRAAKLHLDQVREQSRQLRYQSAAAREKSKEEQARSRSLRRESDDATPNS